MITIDFGGNKRSTPNITTKWIQQSYHQNLDKSGSVCVRITVDYNDIDISLSSSACGSSGGGIPFEQFSSDAQDIIALWHKYGLHEKRFPSGKLVSFLKDLFKKLNMRLT